MKPISSIAKGIAPSATVAVDTLAKQMKADGIDVIGFGAGEPDFPTPDSIKVAAIKAISDNQTRYTPAAGIVPLRNAICQWMKREYGVDYQPSQICVSSGAKHNVFIALQAICNPGDEVILPAPYWVTYEEAIKMTGAVPVVINTTEQTRFKVTPEMLEQVITPKTKALILTNPSNPTGMLYSKQELEAIAQVVLKHDLYVISDEIYDKLVYVGEFTCFATLGEEIKQRTITINGASKSFAMTGWRIGFAAANEEISKAMANYLSHSTGNPCSVSQYAALEAYSTQEDLLTKMQLAYARRRKYFLERIKKLKDVSCLEPDGAFYIFMNIKGLLGRTIQGVTINSSADFAQALLEKGLVAVVPGEAFGAPGYVRWSYATSMENIREGLDRLEKFLSE
ncbi:MAG: pyridoxal phosphate-dependent aminotransferase [Oscillospiraceae bacterium]|nr:pyridoxal phosphate-dependent aminotransferase [Oscillospiraceae bacterium]